MNKYLLFFFFFFGIIFQIFGGEKKSSKASKALLILKSDHKIKGRFIFKNTSGDFIQLTTDYGIYIEEMPFKPGGVIYEYKKNGQWINIPDPIIGYRGTKKIKPGEKIEFDVDYITFNDAGVKSGALVRIAINGVYCKEFKFRGEAQ